MTQAQYHYQLIKMTKTINDLYSEGKGSEAADRVAEELELLRLMQAQREGK